MNTLTMEDDGEEPPLAVEITAAVNESTPHLSTQINHQPETSDAPPVGVTVITGYLGAGKSTVNFLSFYFPLSPSAFLYPSYYSMFYVFNNFRKITADKLHIECTTWEENSSNTQ